MTKRGSNQRIEDTWSSERHAEYIRFRNLRVPVKERAKYFGVTIGTISKIDARIEDVKTTKELKCISCPTMFESQGHHNRMCGNCRYAHDLDSQMAYA